MVAEEWIALGLMEVPDPWGARDVDTYVSTEELHEILGASRST